MNLTKKGSAIKTLADLETLVMEDIMYQISPFPFEHIVKVVNQDLVGSKYHKTKKVEEVCEEVLIELGMEGCVNMISMDLYAVNPHCMGW